MSRYLLSQGGLILAVVLGFSGHAQAVTLSVNTDWGSGNFLSPSDVAGVVPAAHWNNVDFSAGSGVPGGRQATGAGLIDSDGNVTGINFRGYGSGPIGNDTVSGVGPDQTMMSSGIRTAIVGHGGDTNAGQLEFTNLTSVFSSYDVYLYLGEDHPNMGSAGDAGIAPYAAAFGGPGGPDSGIFVSGGAGDYTSSVPSESNDIPAGASIVPYRTRDIASGGFTFDGSYNISTGTSDEGNYVKISGLSLDTLVLTTAPGRHTNNDGSGGFFDTVVVMGVQIQGVPEPSSFVLASIGLLGLTCAGLRRRGK